MMRAVGWINYAAALVFDHPARVCMDYTTHARFAMGLAWDCALASIASVVHAVIPDVLQTYTSRTIQALHARVQNAGCRPPQSTDRCTQTPSAAHPPGPAAPPTQF